MCVSPRAGSAQSLYCSGVQYGESPAENGRREGLRQKKDEEEEEEEHLFCPHFFKTAFLSLFYFFSSADHAPELMMLEAN